jgi:hypothetical protein
MPGARHGVPSWDVSGFRSTTLSWYRKWEHLHVSEASRLRRTRKRTKAEKVKQSSPSILSKVQRCQPINHR